MKFLSANRIDPDETPRFAASHLGLFCLPMSNKKDAGLIWVNVLLNFQGFGYCLCEDWLFDTFYS